MDLKNQNKKSENDFMSLDVLSPSTVKYIVSLELKPLMNHFIKILKDYVTINNEYVNIKTMEEKVKTKKQKSDNSNANKSYEIMDE